MRLGVHRTFNGRLALWRVSAQIDDRFRDWIRVCDLRLVYIRREVEILSLSLVPLRCDGQEQLRNLGVPVACLCCTIMLSDEGCTLASVSLSLLVALSFMIPFRSEASGFHAICQSEPPIGRLGMSDFVRFGPKATL